MKGKLISQEAIVTTPKEWSSVNVVIMSEDNVEYKGNVFLGKNKTVTGLTNGQDVDFEVTTDSYGNKIKIIQPQGAGGGNKGGFGGGGYKVTKEEWLSMQKSICAQSVLHTAAEYCKGNTELKSKDVLALADKMFQFVMEKSELK